MKKWMTALLVAIMVLTGCGGGSKSDGKYNPKVYKDYFVLGDDFESLNYLYSYQAKDFKAIANFVDGLVENDRYGQLVPALAESWEANEDYSVWTFHLREGVDWMTMDKEVYAEVTADDFVYGVEYILNPINESNNTEMVYLIKGAQEYFAAMQEYQKNGGAKPDFSTVGVKAIDKYTVEYTMADGGKPYFLSATCYASFYPANRQYIESLADTADGIPGSRTFATTPELLLYNGAFIMESYTRDTERNYVKNPNYWDLENVTFDRVEIIGIRDHESALEYFRAGDLSYTPLKATQAKAEHDNGNENLVQIRKNQYSYILMMNAYTDGADNTNAALRNENFRKAIFYAFDCKEYNQIENPIDPDYIKGYGLIAADFAFAPDGTDYTQMGSMKKWYGFDNLDVTKALEFKDKAKEELGDSVTYPIVLTYHVKAGNETNTNRALIMKNFLEQNLGTDFVKVQIEEYSTTISELRSQNKTCLIVSGWGPDYQDPVNILATFASDGVMNNATSMSTGYSHWNIPEYDALVAKANAEVKDIGKRYELFAEAENYLLEHAYVVPIFQGSEGTYQLTSVNNYTKPFSMSGIGGYKLKGIEALDHEISAEEDAKFKEEWETERAKVTTKQD